jgi:hypothetical protein
MSNNNYESLIKASVNIHLKMITPEERVDFLYSIRENFCIFCGDEINGKTCHCENDD